MKRIIRLIICTFIVFLFTEIGISVHASNNDNFKIDVNYGYDNYYKVYKDMPVNINIVNDIDDFDGIVKIRYHVNSENDGMLSQKVTCEKGNAKDIKFIIPRVNENLAIIRVILEEKEKVIYEKKFTLPFNQGIESNLMLGVLDEDYDDLNYFNSDICTKVNLNENNFPEDVFASKILDVIIINNYNLSKLNEKQIEVLKEWVIDGGHLIIGSGVNYTKTIPIIEDFIGIDSINELIEADNKILYDVVNEQSDENVINNTPLSIIEFDSSTLKEVVSNGEYGLAYNVKKGKGNIDLYTFDLGMEPMKSFTYNNEFMNLYLLPKFMDKQIRVSNESTPYNRATDFLEIMTQIKYPAIWKIITIIVIYILILGPILYIFLKKRGKRQYMWVFIPVISILFVAIMYVTGINTRIKEPVSQFINILNFSEDGGSKDSFGTVLNTNMSKLRVKSEDGLSMIPIIERNNHFYSTSDDIQYRDFPIYYNLELGLDSTIEYYKSNVLSNNSFKIETPESVPQVNLIDLQLTADGRELTGTVTNNYDFDFKNCIVYFNNMIYTIDNLNESEVKNVGKPIPKSYDSLWRYAWEISRGISDSVEAKKDMYQNAEMLDYIRYIYESINSDEVLFVGFTDETFAKGFQVNNRKIDNKEKTMITSLATVNYIKGSTVLLDYGMVKPLVNGVISEEIAYANDKEFSFTYQMPTETMDMTLVKIRRNPIYSEKFDKGKYYLIANDESYIEMTDSITINKENIDKYISNDGELRMVVIMDDRGDFDVPEIYVEGIGK
ncbi:hypothetical protein SH1V18_26040 [Vallitalea longa]|uniref:Uncharacterized protein n=1 Tax=Vallitalea longa TaxID=2936439 RepID=A0A9W6DGT5_9FIRM|nr:hypothetical protein [Vallitalea longa]GKX30124.1 hypothetical protein SH1V18_26040 [Vallitalea longa]